MFPLHMPFAFALAAGTSLAKAQSAATEAGFASIERIARDHERPSDAAHRAEAAARDGEVRSWYRKPAQSWGDIATGLTAANPFGASFPMMFMFANPVSYNAFAPMPGFSQTHPTAPFGSFAVAPNPFAILTSLSALLPTLALAATQANRALADATLTIQEPNGRAASVTAPQSQALSTPQPGAVAEIARIELERGEGGQPRTAIASMTMPDATVYKIEIPLNPMTAFWPWAGGFGASSYAAPPALDAVETVANKQITSETTSPQREPTKTDDEGTDYI